MDTTGANTEWGGVSETAPPGTQVPPPPQVTLQPQPQPATTQSATSAPPTGFGDQDWNVGGPTTKDWGADDDWGGSAEPVSYHHHIYLCGYHGVNMIFCLLSRLVLEAIGRKCLKTEELFCAL